MQRLANPFPLFLDQKGALVDAGKIYVGTAEADPEVSPINVFWDSALTIPAPQPLRTRGGLIANNGVPSAAYIAEADYSMRVRDADGNLVSYSPSANDIGAVPTPTYQLAAAALTLLAATSPTTIGLDILGAADANAVRSLLSITAGISATGGTVSGNILRQGAGPHLYHNDPTMTSGKLFVTAVGASDPTSAPGDIWAKY